MRRRRTVDGRTAVRRPTLAPVAWPIIAALALAACRASATTSQAPSPTGSTPASATLAAASTGLCAASAALPDAASAERTFVNQAHDALHALAAVPGLARSVSARVLEAMDVVEGDFRASVGEGTLGADLETLRSAADDALRALGMEVPRCGP